MPTAAVFALDRARRKAYRRLIPIVFIAYVIAYIDRSNVGLAQLTMGKDLGFDSAIFGTGAGLFFLGYFLLEIPGSLIVERWSARKWISRIMITWGVIAALTALVKTEGQFYLVRFLLGLAEAGFFPGVIIYLTHWFPARDRARALALVIVAAPVAQIINPPLSLPLLRIGTTEIIDGRAVTFPEVWGMEGWQWMFIVWGLPAVLYGFYVLRALTDRPAQARWLTVEERQALEQELERERTALPPTDPEGHLRAVWNAIKDPRVLLLAAANFSIVCGHYGVEFFLPSIFERWYDLRLGAIVWLVPLPYLAMVSAQLGVSWSSDRSGERWWHTALPMFVGAAALLLTPLSQGRLALSLVCFAVAMAGIRAYLAPFYTLPRLFLRGSTLAGAVGFINAVGNMGGYVGPKVMGVVDRASGSFQGGILFLAGTSAAAGLFIVALRVVHDRQSRSTGAGPAMAGPPS